MNESGDEAFDEAVKGEEGLKEAAEKEEKEMSFSANLFLKLSVNVFPTTLWLGRIEQVSSHSRRRADCRRASRVEVVTHLKCESPMLKLFCRNI